MTPTPDKPAGEASRRIVGYRNPAPNAAAPTVAGATDFSKWLPIYADEARPPPPPTLDDEVVAVLFDPIESDAVLNLEGVVWDLEHKFKVDDGGVCVRSIRRVMAQLETVRDLLTRLKDSSK